MTLFALSDTSGLTPNFIGTIENGKRDPSLTTILSLAKGLGIEPAEFFSSTANVSPAGEQGGRLFDVAPEEIQRAVMMILRTLLIKPLRK